MIEMLDEYFGYDPALMPPAAEIVEIGMFEPQKRVGVRPGWSWAFVEASPANYGTLCARLPAERSDIITLNAALAERDGPVTLYEFGHEQLSSLFPRHVLEGADR